MPHHPAPPHPQASATPLRWLFVAVVALHAVYALLAQRLQWPTAMVWLGPLLLQLGHATVSGGLYHSAGAAVLGRTGAQLGVVLALSTLAASALTGAGAAAEVTPHPVPAWGLAALQAALGVATQALWAGFEADTTSSLPMAASGPDAHADTPPIAAAAQALTQALQSWATQPPVWLNDASAAVQPLQRELQTLTRALAAHNAATATASDVSPNAHAASHWQATAAQLTEALQRLHDQARSHTHGLEALPQLAQHQQALLHLAQQQLKTLDALGGTLARLDATLQRPSAGDTPQRPVTELPPELQALLADRAQTRMQLDIALTDLAHKLEANTLATRVAATTLGHKLDASAQSTAHISQKLHDAASASALVAHKLNAVALADIEAASTLHALGQHASDGLGKLDHTLDLMQVVVQQLTGLDRALRAQSAQLTQVAQRIQDVKVVVESPSATPPVTRIHHLHDEPVLAAAAAIHPAPPAAPHGQAHATTGAVPTRVWTVPTTSLSTAAVRQPPTEAPAPDATA